MNDFNTNTIIDNIYTIPELLMAASIALDTHNDVMLEQLIQINHDWMQTEIEHDAQHQLLNAMLEAVYQLQSSV